MSNMKFKKYTKYKDSKIGWIEEIPADWKINKVKYLVDKSVYYPIGDGDHGQITPDMYQDKGVPYIRVQNLSWNGEILFKGMVYISEEINLVNKKSILKPQDLLIAKTGATIGKIGFMPKNINLANTTSSVGKITINKKIHSPFFWNYYFQSDIFQNQIFISAYQKSAQPGFNIEDLVDFIVIIPSLKEQFIIANFLDKKTAEIDELIEKDKKLIELLKERRVALINQAVTKGLDPNAKLKDSGIEWIGEIPEGWYIGRLKNKALIKYGSSLSELERSEGNINVFGSNGKIGKHNKSITKGKTIIIGRKGSYGKLNLSGNSCFPIDTTYFIDNTCTKYDLKYLFYLITQLKLDETSRDSAVPGLSRELIKQFKKSKRKLNY